MKVKKNVFFSVFQIENEEQTEENGEESVEVGRKKREKKRVVDFIHYYQFVFLISVLSFVETKKIKN